MTKQKNKYKIFSTISDLLFYSIEQNNEDLAREMITFLTKVFIEYRNDRENQKIIYPDEFYDTIFEANELVCIKQKRTISHLNGSIFLDLYIDSFQKTILSDKTYNALWVGIRQALNYNRNEIITSYWKNAHQHFSFNLNSITPIYDNENGKFTIKNNEQVDKRNDEREKFLEFHFVIGGLLVFLQKYKLLKNILNYTNQTPPRYYLIPGTLIEIVNGLLKIKEDYKNPFHFEQRYSFPDVDGVNKGGVIRFWTRKYFAILFLRQYKLHDYYYGHNIFDLPNIPNSLSEMKYWEQELDYFKNILSEILKDNDLLTELGYKELTNEKWFEDNNKQHPIELIDNIIRDVKYGYEEKKTNQKISHQKEDEFYVKTKEIIIKSISKFDIVNNTDDIDGDFIKHTLNGTCQLLDKTAFTDDQDISYLNSDTIVAQTLSANLSLNITRTFISLIKERYLFEPVNIFSSIDRMGFDFNKYIIISFGVYLKHYTETLKIIKLKEKDNEFYFKGSKIINLNTYIDPNLIGSLIVISKNDLPKFLFNEISKEESTKYEPKQLVEQYQLYAKLINLNDNNKIREELRTSNVEDLTKKVLACILINWEIRWKKTSEIYQFKVFEQFNNSGKPNSFSDLKPIKDKE